MRQAPTSLYCCSNVTSVFRADATVEAAAAVVVVPASAHAMSAAGLTAVASAILALALL